MFKVDIETCEHCSGAVKVIASIEASAVIKQILAHLARRDAATLDAIGRTSQTWDRVAPWRGRVASGSTA